MTETHLGTAQPSRSAWLGDVEALRALAFVFIVLGHATTSMSGLAIGVVSTGVLCILLALTRFALPAFMAISALLIARGVAAGKPDKIGSSFARLFAAYALWTVFYFLFGQSMASGAAPTVRQLLLGFTRALATGTAYYHLWYMLIALQIVIVAPFVARALLKLDTGARRSVLAAAVAATMVLLGLLWGPFLAAGPVLSVIFGQGADRIVVFWTAYIVLGIAIGLDHDSAATLIRKARWILLPLYVLAAGAIGWLVWGQAVATGGDFAATAEISRVMQPWILPFELLSALVWLDIGGLLAATRASGPLRLLASTSFGGYLVHPFWITVGSSLVLERYLAPMPLVTVAGLATLALLASVGTTLMLGRLRSPLGEALVGRLPSRPRHTEVPPVGVLERDVA